MSTASSGRRPVASRPAYLALVGSAPIVPIAVQVALGSAPLSTLWFGLVLAIVAVLLFRLLSGFAPFGSRRLHFGSASPIRGWQAPMLWVALVVMVAAALASWLAAR